MHLRIFSLLLWQLTMALSGRLSVERTIRANHWPARLISSGTIPATPSVGHVS